MGDIGRSQCAIPAKMLVFEQIERKPHGILFVFKLMVHGLSSTQLT